MFARVAKLHSHSLLACLALAWFPAVASTATNAESIVSGDFELVDHSGRTVTQKTYAGKYRLVFFGFTECPDVCPTTLLQVARALNELDDRANEIQTLFISVDPKNDSSQRLRAYVHAFHESIIGLTGSDEQIANAASSFNVTYGIKTADESVSGRQEVYHSAYLFLMDRDGKFLDIFGFGAQATQIASELQKYLK